MDTAEISQARRMIEQAVGAAEGAASYPINDTPASLAFQSDNLEVLFIQGGTSFLLITFNEAGQPGNGQRVWGETLVRAANISTLGFMTRSANWFPAADMHAALTTLQPLLARFPERILFGHSMGGYASLKYSRLLGSSVSMSFCPQYSINPDDVGAFDDRYLKSFRPDFHGHMRITAADVCDKAYVFYDPLLIDDRKNVELICAAAPWVNVISMTNTTHGTIQAFRGTTAATQLFALCRAGSLTEVKAYAAIRRRTHPERPRLILAAAIERHLPWGAALWSRVCAGMQREVASWYANRIAILALQRGRTDVCRSVMGQALQLLPNDAKLLDDFSHILGQSGDIQGAIGMALRRTELTPGDAGAQMQLANLLMRNRDLPGARDAALTALEVNPNDLSALLVLADIDHQTNQPDQTAFWLTRAVAQQPNDVGLLSRLARVMLRAGNLTAARQAAQKAIAAAANETAPLKLLAEIEQRDSNPAEALAVLHRAAAIDPDDRHTNALLAHLLLQAGELGQAQAYADRVLSHEPGHIGALCSMVEISFRAQDQEQAARWARAVAGAERATLGNREWAAWMLARAGDLDGARQIALSVLGSDPSHAGTLHCLADISIRTNNRTHAIVWARRAADAQPDAADRHAYLASLLMQQGDISAARCAAQAALSRQAGHGLALRLLSDIDAGAKAV